MGIFIELDTKPKVCVFLEFLIPPWQFPKIHVKRLVLFLFLLMGFSLVPEVSLLGMMLW